MDTNITTRSDEYLDEYDSGFLKSPYPHWSFHSFYVKCAPSSNWVGWMLLLILLSEWRGYDGNRGENRTLIPLSYHHHSTVLKAMAEKWNLDFWEFCSSSFPDFSGEILHKNVTGKCKNSSVTVWYILMYSSDFRTGKLINRYHVSCF